MTILQEDKPIQSDTASLPSGPPAADRHVTFLADPIMDNLLRAVVTLTMELSVTRERLKSLEQVLGDLGQPVTERIDALAVTAEDDAVRRAERERMIESILAPIIKGLTDRD
ncbi:hypothetical protein PX699_15005 [Sphingobium sp. H39-3-25]|uniref:hypothetical protein n=1 Tax=Sphingobium arseniciresistens TaxID=3030834 RepID=UPI0023B8ADCF|nr:hypothetical protein [Sphingobium arseniciresistens]